MASLSKEGSGWRIQFFGPDGKRRNLRLGKTSKKHAESIKVRLEHLASAALSKFPVDDETARWLGSVGDDLHDKLAAAGLIPKRYSAGLGAFLDDYLSRRRADSKGTTVCNIERVCIDLVTLYGSDTAVRSITPALADDLATHYATRKLANATAARRLKVARMIFKHAVRHKLADANPFLEVKGPPSNPNPERQHYVPRDVVHKVIEGCSPEWQLVAALSRFAGLRAPSEVLLLRWSDIDLPGNVMVVRSPKTEHHANGASRRVPIFPDLRPYLADAFERCAETGAEFVVNGVGERGRAKMLASKNGWTGVNLSVAFGKMVERAGFKLWPKVMHNMRASCETDLAGEHPLHVVCGWLGNTPKIAIGHYLQTNESDFQRAVGIRANSGSLTVQNPAQPAPDGGGQELPTTAESSTIPSELAAKVSPCRPEPVRSDARDRT